MIPSSLKRTLLFTLLSSLAYFGPDFLMPAAWTSGSAYVIAYTCYQCALVVAAFWYAPALCKILVVREISRENVTIGSGNAASGTALPVTLFDHPMPFVLTAGLLPGHCEVFISSGMAYRLSTQGMNFVLARAAVHATPRQRLAALVPALFFAGFFPDTPKTFFAWLAAGGFLLVWLLIHWAFELDVDRHAARMVGTGAADGLRDMLAVTNPRASRLTIQPPLAWRMRAVN